MYYFHRYILDGFPLTKAQVDLMTERSIIPVRVVEMQVDPKSIVERALKDRFSTDRSVQHQCIMDNGLKVLMEDCSINF